MRVHLDVQQRILAKNDKAAIVNKIDIAEAVGFEQKQAIANLQKMAPQATLFEVSARTGEGMEA